MELYTKYGQPLQAVGKNVYSRSGRVVGRINGKKFYGPDGRYVGIIVSGRLVYRSTDSAGVGSPFSTANRAGTAKASRAGSGIWGEELYIIFLTDIGMRRKNSRRQKTLFDDHALVKGERAEQCMHTDPGLASLHSCRRIL